MRFLFSDKFERIRWAVPRLQKAMTSARQQHAERSPQSPLCSCLAIGPQPTGALTVLQLECARERLCRPQPEETAYSLREADRPHSPLSAFNVHGQALPRDPRAGTLATPDRRPTPCQGLSEGSTKACFGSLTCEVYVL